MINKCMFMGRLVADPDVRDKNGKKIVKIRLAINRRIKGQTYTEYIPVLVMGVFADIIPQYVKKGDMLFVEARAFASPYEVGDKKITTYGFIMTDFSFVPSTRNSGSNSSSVQPQVVARQTKKVATANAKNVEYYEDLEALEQELDASILDNFELDEEAPF